MGQRPSEPARDLRDDARDIAQGLTVLCVAKGESVAIIQPNGRDSLAAIYAALYGGFRATMINLAAGPAAISYALDHSGARFAFVHPSQTDTFAVAAPDGATALSAEHLKIHAPLHDVDADDHALLMYTSGTTGKPKGVVHSQSSPLTPQDRGFCVLPIYHINGLCVTVMGALVSGGSLAMVPRFSSSKFWGQIKTGDATWFSVVPTIISYLLHATSDPDAATRARLRFGRSASSALAVETQSAFEDRFGVPIIETMGLTETAAQILSNPLPPGVRKIGCPGHRVWQHRPDHDPRPDRSRARR